MTTIEEARGAFREAASTYGETLLAETILKATAEDTGRAREGLQEAADAYALAVLEEAMPDEMIDALGKGCGESIALSLRSNRKHLRRRIKELGR